jgi:hypothetical protein
MSDPKKKKTTDELLDEVRNAVKDGIDNTLDYADTFVGEKPPTAKEMATNTYDIVVKNASVTINLYRSAYKLLFPKK